MTTSQSIDWTAIERVSPLLTALSVEARLASRLVRAPQSSRLFNRGDKPSSMYFVLDGEVRLVRHSSAGHELVLQRCRLGVLAEASIDQSAYHCDAVSTVPSMVVAIQRKAFRNALADPSFQRAWTDHLTRELRRARAHIERLHLRTARERIVHYVEIEGHKGAFTLKRSKKDWAAELGITHEALYRTLSSMERDGELSIRGSTIALAS